MADARPNDAPRCSKLETSTTRVKTHDLHDAHIQRVCEWYTFLSRGHSTLYFLAWGLSLPAAIVFCSISLLACGVGTRRPSSVDVAVGLAFRIFQTRTCKT